MRFLGLSRVFLRQKVAIRKVLGFCASVGRLVTSWSDGWWPSCCARADNQSVMRGNSELWERTPANDRIASFGWAPGSSGSNFGRCHLFKELWWHMSKMKIKCALSAFSQSILWQLVLLSLHNWRPWNLCHIVNIWAIQYPEFPNWPLSLWWSIANLQNHSCQDFIQIVQFPPHHITCFCSRSSYNNAGRVK